MVEIEAEPHRTAVAVAGKRDVGETQQPGNLG